MEKNLTVSFSDPRLGADSFWAYMVQKEEAVKSDAVTAAQAAEVIDNVYDIRACGTEEEQETASTGGESNLPDFPTWEEYQERMSNAFAPIYDPCNNVFVDNSYLATLEIYRSDVTKPYKLNLTNGDVKQKSTVTKIIKITLPINGDTVQVTLPIMGSLSANYEIQDFNSKTILFKEIIIGAVDLTYETIHDEVIVNVNPIDGERASCQCLLFYQSTVSEVNINPPEVDEESQNLLECQPASDPESAPEPYVPIEHEEGDCYQRYIYTTMCNCFPYDSTAASDEVRTVPCSTAFSAPTPEGVYNSFQDAVHINGYVICYSLEPWEGSEREFYIEKCCVPPPRDMSLPICRESKKMDYGGKEILHGADYYIQNALTNEVISLVPVNPKDGICGEITYVYDVEALNCCDDPAYVEMVFDVDNSVEVLADFSSGYIFWEEGKVPYTVSVRGNGFYLDPLYTVKDADTRFTYAVIYTEDACGPCTVTISDGCSEISTTIRSTNGYWDYISADCELPGVGGEILGATTLYVEYISGKYKQTQAIVGQQGLALKRQLDTNCNDRVYDDCADAGYECAEDLTIEDVYGHDLCDSSMNGYQFSWNGNGCVSFKANDHYLGAGIDWYDESDCGAVVFDHCGLGDYSVNYDCSCWYRGFVKSYLTKGFWEWKC